MDDYKIIVEQEHQTVMAHYEVVSRWDRYLGITAPMTQVPVPTATTHGYKELIKQPSQREKEYEYYLKTFNI